MTDRKIFELFRKFSPKELKLFSKFLNSPYHNNNSRLVPLYEYLCRYAPGFDHPKLSDEAIRKKLFKQSKSDPNAVIRLYSAMLKMAEQFIAVQKSKENPVDLQIDVLRFYRERQLDRLFKQKLRELSKLQNASGNIDEDYYLREFNLQSEIATFESMRDDRTGDINLQNELKAFKVYTIARELSLYCLMKLRQSWVDVDYDYLGIRAEDNALSCLDEEPVPFIECLVAAARLLDDPNSSKYYHLKNLLTSHDGVFERKKMRNFYGMLEHGAMTVFTDREALYHEFFELNEIQISKELFLVDGVIVPQTIKNITTTALRLKKFEWARRFLADHKKFIESEDVFRWNLARLYFHEGNFDECLDILHDIKVGDMFYVLATKRLLLKTYYEIGAFELLIAFLNAFRTYLTRGGIVKEQKESNRNFLSLLSRLVGLHPPGRKNRVIKVKKRIEQTKNTAEKDWLLQKVDALI